MIAPIGSITDNHPRALIIKMPTPEVSTFKNKHMQTVEIGMIAINNGDAA